AFTLAETPGLQEIVAVDYSPVFFEAATRRNTDPRVSILQADACALPFEDNRFDRAMSHLGDRLSRLRHEMQHEQRHR
ncbi:class I SAM-dependent methyltransferase, partial [Rhizobium ruizarguesonis]